MGEISTCFGLHLTSASSLYWVSLTCGVTHDKDSTEQRLNITFSRWLQVNEAKEEYRCEQV